MVTCIIKPNYRLSSIDIFMHIFSAGLDWIYPNVLKTILVHLVLSVKLKFQIYDQVYALLYTVMSMMTTMSMSHILNNI